MAVPQAAALRSHWPLQARVRGVGGRTNCRFRILSRSPMCVQSWWERPAAQPPRAGVRRVCLCPSSRHVFGERPSLQSCRRTLTSPLRDRVPRSRIESALTGCMVLRSMEVKRRLEVRSSCRLFQSKPSRVALLSCCVCVLPLSVTGQVLAPNYMHVFTVCCVLTQNSHKRTTSASLPTGDSE